MKIKALLLAAGLIAWSAATLAQSTPKGAIAADTFDPAVHAVGRLVEGRLELLVSEYVLNKSLLAALPDAGRVEKLEKRRSGGRDYLVFTTPPDGGGRRVIGVPLRADGAGYVFADAGALICDGSTTCTDCQPIEGCPCTEGGTCTSRSLSNLALGAVPTRME